MAESLITEDDEDFPDNVVVERFISTDSEGTPTYDTAGARSLPARISGKTQVVTDMFGNEYTSTVHLVFNGAFGVSAKDRFTLPARFSRDAGGSLSGIDALRARQPEARAVTRTTDENGPHHEKVYF